MRYNWEEVVKQRALRPDMFHRALNKGATADAIDAKRDFCRMLPKKEVYMLYRSGEFLGFGAIPLKK
jgi:hypothetical protein